MKPAEHTIEHDEAPLGRIARTLFPRAEEPSSASAHLILFDGSATPGISALQKAASRLAPDGVMLLRLPRRQALHSPMAICHDLHTAGLRATHLYLPFPSVRRMRFLIPLGSKQALRFALCSLHDQRHPLLSLLFRWLCAWSPSAGWLARFAREYLVVATHE